MYYTFSYYLTIFLSTSMIPVRTSTDGSTNDINGRSLWSRSPNTSGKLTLPPTSHQEHQPLLHRGSSAENISAQQNSNTQKGVQNGTLKKLKTGKEQVRCYKIFPS